MSLSEQRRHQVRLARRWMTWWIPAIFAVGLGVSLLGLAASIALFQEKESPGFTLFLFAGSTVFFGWIVVASVFWPLLTRSRIVPYFARELEAYGGTTMAAFKGGRGLYREIVALDDLASALDVTPLSAFGFADDHYEQEVHWHAASEGLRTVEALLEGLDARLRAAPDVPRDLQALAAVLRTAADQRVEFSLVLRLHARDSMQAVCTREARQGSFW
jgi:hypothetical protein